MANKLIVLGVLIFLIVSFSLFMFIDSSNQGLNEATGLVVGEGSFPIYLETHPVVASLPKDASIGVRIGKNSYDINGRNVNLKEDLSNKDLIVSLPEGYEKVIGELGLCGAAKQAYKDHKIVLETTSSKVSLFFKYRKLLRYGDCIK